METKKVFIKRRIANNNIPKESFIGTNATIGATMDRSGNTNTGLSFDEEKKLMPRILGVQYDSVDYNKKLNYFFADLRIKVAYGEQVELDISNDGEGNYRKPLDYIKYKFALANTEEVAKSKEECVGNKKFYIYDPNLKLAQDYDKLSAKKDAYKEFLKVASDNKKINTIMAVLGLNTKGLSDKEKELKLEDFVNNNPDTFITTVKDKDLETKAFIEDLISAQIVQKVGNSILDGDEVLGGSLQEAVLFLNDKKNSETFVKLKARLEAFKK